MSPAAEQRFLVVRHDYEEWRAVVLATDETDARHKAQRMYDTDGLDANATFPALDRNVDWRITPLVPELVR